MPNSLDTSYLYHIQTDRPLYRPGNTVHFSGMVKQFVNDGALKKNWYFQVTRHRLCTAVATAAAAAAAAGGDQQINGTRKRLARHDLTW